MSGVLVLAGLGIWLGAPPLPLMAAAAVTTQPRALAPLLGLALVAALRSRRDQGGGGEPVLFVLLASELRAGSSLRAALADLAHRHPHLAAVGRLATAGRPMEEIAEGLRRALPGYGREAAATVAIAASTGGAVAEAFDHLAAVAAADADLAREQRIATAGARASVALLVAIPVGVTLLRFATGGGFHPIALFGSVLVLLGVAWVTAQVRGLAW